MLTYDMETRGSLPLYEYLYRCIRSDILSGVLPEGARLPSKRALAEHLQISVITVEGAYAQLEAEGYLLAQPRRGFFVAAVEHSPSSKRASVSCPETHPVPWKLDLSRNQADASRFPTSTWAKLTRQVLTESNDTLFSPIQHQGLFALRQAIADDLRNYKGMSVSPAQIIVGAGAEYLYLLLPQLLGRDAVFALEDPGYPKIRQVYEACGVSCRSIPLDQQGISLSALANSDATVVHLSPSHHYPTGLVTPIGRRQSLLRWAEKHDGYIIEDDYDSEFRFAGRPIPTLQSIDQTGRVIYLNTFSQTIAPSMRVGFMVLPPPLLERYRANLDFYACTVPALEQHVLARFLQGGHYEQHLSRMRKEYRFRRAAVMDAFRSGSFSGRVTFSEEGAGLHFLLKIDTQESDDALRHRAEALGMKLAFLSDFSAAPNPDYDHTLVVNYAGLSSQRLAEAVALLEKLLASSQGGPH